MDWRLLRSQCRRGRVAHNGSRNPCQKLVPKVSQQTHPTPLTRGLHRRISERLLAGDILYSGVYDNKEPLFYYFVAAQLAMGRWAEAAAEALLIAIAAAAVYFMAVKLSSQWTAVAISFIAVPITLTGGHS